MLDLPCRVDKNDDGTLTLLYSEENGSTHPIVAHQVMFATGRKPYFKDLGLEVCHAVGACSWKCGNRMLEWLLNEE